MQHLLKVLLKRISWISDALKASEDHRVASKCGATTCCVLVPSRVMTWDEKSVLNLSRSVNSSSREALNSSPLRL